MRARTQKGPPAGGFRLTADVTLGPGRRVLVFYYPASGPLRIGAGTLVGVDPVGPPDGAGPAAQVRYVVPLEPGASGAPCLDVSGAVFALHHGRAPTPGDPPDLRSGVSAAAVLADLTAAGKGDALGAEPTPPPRHADPHPPRPEPIVHEDDPQKDRWGRESERNGRKLSAAIVSDSDRLFTCSFIVSSTDGTALDPPVVFHLHDSFPRMVVFVRKTQGNGTRAALEDVAAYGAFTVGAQVRDASGHWIGLEYDLVDHPDLPVGSATGDRRRSLSPFRGVR